MLDAVPGPPVPAHAADGMPHAGWGARLELQFERAGARTRLAHRRHEGPLLVQRVFYPEGAAAADRLANDRRLEGDRAAEPCHVYLIHPPGGVVGGDQLQLDVVVGARAHALLTTPAAGKFYRCGGRSCARVTQSLEIDGVLEWLPQENIFYPGCMVELRTIAHLRAAARFIGWELGCLGLPANRQPLGDGELRQAFELWRDGRPLLLERLHIERACLDAAWGLSGHVGIGTWLACPAPAQLLPAARAVLAGMDCAGMTIACTLVDGVLVCRGYAARTDRLRQVFVDLWRALRPALLDRAAVPPRIWAT
jgi:urease accessory protein